MISKAVKFTAGFILVLLVVYVVHTRLVSIKPEVLPLVNFSYLFNFGFTYIFLINFIIFRDKLIYYIGYLFLALSTLKLSAFLYLIKASNFELNKSVFFHFFIPFVLCVGVEIFYLLHELNSANFNNDN